MEGSPLKTRYCFAIVLCLATSLAVAVDSPLEGVHTAITVKVPNYVEAQSRIQQWASQNGLDISATVLESTQKGRKHGWLKLQGPVDKLTPALDQISSLGKVVQSRRWTDNLGWEKMKSSSRLSRVKDHADRLNSLLRGRNIRVQDKMYLYDRLFQNGIDQDDLSAELADLEIRAKEATINVTLFEPYLPTENAPNESGPRKTLGGLRSQLATITADAIAWFVATLMRVLVYLPIWVPAFFLLRRWSKKLMARLGRDATPGPA